MGKTTTQMQLVEISKLIPYVNNARTHSAEQITKLRSSLREFGFINPVIIDSDYNVIAGHGRIEAAKLENIKEVPCVLVDYLTPAQKRAYIIADNRMAMDAGWDEELLKIEIEALQYRPKGLPSKRYINVCKEGYLYFGFDTTVLKRAIEKSKF